MYWKYEFTIGGTGIFEVATIRAELIPTAKSGLARKHGVSEDEIGVRMLDDCNNMVMSETPDTFGLAGISNGILVLQGGRRA